MSTKELMEALKSVSWERQEFMSLRAALNVLGQAQDKVIPDPTILYSEAPFELSNIPFAKLFELRYGDGLKRYKRAVSAARSAVTAIAREIKGWDIPQLFSALTLLKERIARVDPMFQAAFVPSIEGSIEEFTSSLDLFIRSWSEQKTVEVIMSGSRLLWNWEILTSAHNYLKPSEIQGEHPPETTTLSLQLSRPSTVAEFGATLTALGAVYSELCALLAVSEAANPCTILKIEVGSLSVIISGAASVLASMSRIVESTARYLHRTYTIDGRIGGLPRNASALDVILNLRDDLKARGFETDNMDEHIIKASVLIAKSLEDALQGDPKVSVDSVEILIVDSANTQKRLEDQKPPEERAKLLQPNAGVS